MRWRVTFVLAVLLLGTAAFAKDNSNVPRYQGFGAGVDFQYGMSLDGSTGGKSAAEFYASGIRFSAIGEYTAPHFDFLPLNSDLGASLAVGFDHISDYDWNQNALVVAPSVFYRLPFFIGNQYFAFQPALGYEFILTGIKSDYYSRFNGNSYVDNALALDLSLRYMPKALPALEIAFTPHYELWIEPKNTLSKLYFRLGAVWHFNHVNPVVDEDYLDSTMDPPVFDMTIEGEHLTPDGDGENDTVLFRTKLTNVIRDPDAWNLSIVDSRGRNFKTFKGKGKIPEQIEWDGIGDSGEMVYSRSTYIANFTVILSQKDVKRNGGLTISSSDFITTGVVLETIVPHHEWKMVVNEAIKFDEDKATFDRLSPQEKRDLDETINDVAYQIKNHEGVHVYVQGYANNVSGTQEEEAELVTLSKARADAIVELLVKKGISSSILTAEGMGGANPIASRDDKENWWKNRRVEFILKK